MKILKTIYYVVAGFLCAVAVLLIISTFPITGNFKVLTVLSGSMEPKIHTGSVVVVLPVKDYKIGNIITFGPYSKTEPPTTHRIADIKVNGNQPVYITKGDANDSADSREVARKDIEGKVLFSIPYFGFIISFIRKPLGFILLIIIPAMIMLLDEIRKIIKEIKTKKSQSQNV